MYAFSSGALLACHAAAKDVPLEKLVLLEPPFPTPGRPEADPSLGGEVARLVAADRRDEAVGYWLTAIGVPSEIIAKMGPARRGLEAVAHTLVYDAVLAMETHTDIVREVENPTLILSSEESDAPLADAAAGLARALPNATHRTLPGDWHGVDDEVLAPAIKEFLRG